MIDRYRDPSPSIKAILPSTPVDLVFDAVHWPVEQAQIDLLSPGGLLLSIGNIPETGLDFSGNKRATFFVGTVHYYHDLGVAMNARLYDFLDEGIIKV